MNETLILQLLGALSLIMIFLIVGIEKYKDIKEEEKKSRKE